ncbi:enoyl-CoA hydratase [Salipiger aestuarii]|uniref:Enoyl-CoA hydratase domain-containing protein 3, mitochondrial n=1 Tax=Salipiger aestuarii TaxID=568098 RepID=A0A327YYL4_9RHOB|nr:enoyl-CoA hydratase [Salipiger aestuarii]EIE50665.1 enoyl-CoA hydratase [Citreicella sp. 357]KAA8607329.1 enoyl-CoA hydratase [Salipiger aestuarii]KAA8612978.1 enoyl-CoA hydratase [Salipiger aestuarii]KAB2543757.1 enoyl-CoA hydratase [Salipiger aestuarii]RAK23009.1 enoyl-CoA hydratase/carnithine racemase [Salipiger aestuarii]
MALLERHDTGHVAHLQLNAPERLNALSDEMLAALMAQIDALSQDRAIRAVVLSGAGKVFCAGHDLKQMQAGRQADDDGRAYFADLFARCSAVMTGLQRLPQPVIAQVHGIATAAGCQLVASCDMAVAAKGTRFGVNGVNIGLFCSTPMVALTRNIPAKHAFEMLSTGRFADAEEARQMGLVNRVVPHDQLGEVTLDLARTVADKLGAAVKIGKSAFYAQAGLAVDEAYAYAGAVMVENMLWRDTDEGISAFLEKRDPDWRQ